jgi:hypothetical protein
MLAETVEGHAAEEARGDDAVGVDVVAGDGEGEGFDLGDFGEGHGGLKGIQAATGRQPRRRAWRRGSHGGEASFGDGRRKGLVGLQERVAVHTTQGRVAVRAGLPS